MLDATRIAMVREASGEAPTNAGGLLDYHQQSCAPDKNMVGNPG